MGPSRMQGNRSGNVGATRDSEREETMSATGVKGEAFRVGRVIGRSFSVLVQNIAPVALLALLVLSLPYVLGYILGIRYSGGPFNELETAAWSWREALALTLQYFLANCLGAVLAVGVYETLQGHRPGAWALIRRGLVRFPGVLAVVVVVTVPRVLLGVVAAVRVEEPWPMPWLSTLGPSVAFPALIAGMALTFLAWIYLFVAIPAAAVEGLGVMRSIEQSIELVRRGILRVIGLLLTVWFITFAAFVAPGLLLEWVGIEITAAHFRILVWPDLLLSAFEAALWAIVGAVAYHDLRASREGRGPTRPAAGLD